MLYKNFIKPLFDISCAAMGVIILMPLIILIALLIFIATGENPFFSQTRIKKGNAHFRIIKFKSMNNKRDTFGKLLSDGERITAVGAFIRKTSLDELPQLFNVVLGDMSIIGPRPLLPEYLPLYSKDQARRHLVKPGITGWAQINGRNAIGWNKKFEYDVWYVSNLSFLIDLKIIFSTIKKVIKTEDINTQGEATTAPFKGQNN